MSWMRTTAQTRFSSLCLHAGQRHSCIRTFPRWIGPPFGFHSSRQLGHSFTGLLSTAANLFSSSSILAGASRMRFHWSHRSSSASKLSSADANG